MKRMAQIMRNFIQCRKKIVVSLAALTYLLMSGGCMAHKMRVEVVIFNYNTQPVAEFKIQDKYIGGYYQEYGQGGTGGKIYCCIDVRPGEATVEWVYGGTEGTPKAGSHAHASGMIPEPEDEYKYLGVHLYPDEHVEFTLTRYIPGEKKKGEP